MVYILIYSKFLLVQYFHVYKSTIYYVYLYKILLTVMYMYVTINKTKYTIEESLEYLSMGNW